MTGFRSPPEEVTRLLQEIQETKASLRVIANRLGAMDKHLRRAFQIPKISRERKAPRRSGVAQTATRTDLLARFDQLRADYATADPSRVTRALSEFADDDLRALAMELGLSGTRKASVAKLSELITQKVRESALLGGGSMFRGPEERARAVSDADAAPSASVAPDA